MMTDESLTAHARVRRLTANQRNSANERRSALDKTEVLKELLEERSRKGRMREEEEGEVGYVLPLSPIIVAFTPLDSRREN